MSGVSTREARAKVAVRLRRQGLKQREIAERMGISRSYAADLYGDPSGEKTRARKNGYRGVCEVCGAPTNGSNGAGKAATRCLAHNLGAEKMKAKAGTWGFTNDMLVLIGEGLDRYSDLRDALGISNGYVSVSLDRFQRYGWIERVSRGRYRLTPLGVEKTAASA